VATATQAPPVTTHVQLAAVPSETDARAEWQRLQKRMPALLTDRRPLFIREERNGRTFWEIRTGGFTDPAQAKAFCQQVLAAGLGCFVNGV
jgi:hypothetical protein